MLLIALEQLIFICGAKNEVGNVGLLVLGRVCEKLNCGLWMNKTQNLEFS